MFEEILSEQNFAKLHKAIEENKDRRGALMPVLHEAQHIFGCVPEEVVAVISKELNIAWANIYGVITFYSQFTLVPKGKYTISVCLGTACYVKGSQKIINKIAQQLNVEIGETTEDGLFSLVATRCIGACGLAPILTVNEEVYGSLTEADIPRILAKYTAGGERS